jgi:MFS transporter, ACS family, glucarate transporter
VLTRVVLWWSAFTSLTGAITSYPVLLLVRFCFGMGEAGAFPNASIVVGRWMPPMNRARAWGVIWMTAQVGGAISPLLVVPIQIRYGWHASFYLFGFVGVIWAVAWYAWFRDWPMQKAGVSAAELREIGAEPPVVHGGLPWRRALRSAAFWRIAGIAAATSTPSPSSNPGCRPTYDAPFIPMVVLLGVGVWLWLKVDPERQLFEDDLAGREAAALTA